ncbi:MAG: copper ion binding protein [Bacillota bacterium]|nr:copper ion binding protein [Bacillota bacterium]
MIMAAATEVTLNVPGMSCMHCEKAIKAALGQLNGVADVRVDLGAKKVKVTYSSETVSPDVLAKALEAAGYPVAGQR